MYNHRISKIAKQVTNIYKKPHKKVTSSNEQQTNVLMHNEMKLRIPKSGIRQTPRTKLKYKTGQKGCRTPTASLITTLIKHVVSSTYLLNLHAYLIFSLYSSLKSKYGPRRLD